MPPRAWQDKLSLKTYPLGPDDPNPAFQPRSSSWRAYPYTLRDDLLEGGPEMKDYTALHIENEYLHCIVLPELGGRLYSLYDKVCEREVFYRNNVAKYGLVAVRGPWLSGGIEFNFPTGHSYTTVDPVSWEMSEDHDSAWIAVGNICRVSRMEWWVRLYLRPDERVLYEQIYLHNRMPYKQRYWFWNNSAVPATEDLHLIYPARKAWVSGGVVDYPVTAEGVDISWYKNHHHADDIFTLGVTEDFFGVHYQNSDFGMVNVSDHWDVQGRKFFTWGTADDGMIWVDLLTDDDGQYVEIQSGRFETQHVYEFLKPRETLYWEEQWLPVHGMDGWVWASESGCLNFEHADGKIKLGALTTTAHEGVVLSLEAAGKSVWRHEIIVGPGCPFKTEIDLPAGCDASTEFILTLSDPTEEPLDDEGPLELIRYIHPPLHTRKPKVAETGEDVMPRPTPEDDCTAEELCVRATDSLRHLAHGEARRLCEKALSLDEGFAPAHTILGLLDCRSALYESARDHLEKAVARDKENAEAWHLLGLARWKCGDHEGAELALRDAYRRQGPLGAGWDVLQDVRLEEEDETSPEGAEDDIPAYILAGGPGGPTGYGFGRYSRLWHDGPIDEPVRRFAQWARGDVQNWLEQALASGLEFAIRTMELAIEHCPGADQYPMTHYCLAYWYARAGRNDDATEAYDRAKACPPDYCFPSRLEELPILEAAVERDPSDWKARYYLGNLLASLDRTEEAMAQWREVVGQTILSGGFAVLHRNLGLGAFHWEDNAEGAAEHYRRAIECNPAYYRYYLDLLQIHSTLGKGPEEQLKLLISAPSEVQSKWQIAARIAELLSQLGRHDEALDILRSHQFYPWEGGRHMRTVYVNCLMAKGEAASAAGDHAEALAHFEAAMEYPRNLGVGKLARPQDARVYWLAALEAGELGEAAKKDEHLTIAAGEPHRGISEADWWKLLALRELGREEAAVELETRLREWAEAHLQHKTHGAAAAEMLERLKA